MVKLSIITVCKNAENTIEKTILSVLNQTFQDYEYIVIDGNSTDHTLDIIKRYENEFICKNIHIRVVSEPDHGIYDAMNKGAAKSESIWLMFLNADDVLASGRVLDLIFMQCKKDSDILFGNTRIFSEIDHYDYVQIPKAENLNKEILVRMPFIHQSSLIKKKVFLNYTFDTDYLYGADYKIFLNAFLDRAVFQYVDVIISNYSNDGFSGQASNSLCEYRKIKKEANLYQRISIGNKIYCIYAGIRLWVRRIAKRNKLILKIFVKRQHRRFQ